MPTPQRLKDYTNTLHGRIKTLIKGAKKSSKDRGHEFNITYEDLMRLWKAQNGRCLYTGWNMTTTTKDLTLVSIERHDNSIGYIPENVVLVCWCVNKARGTMEKKDFLTMVKAISQHYDKTENQNT